MKLNNKIKQIAEIILALLLFPMFAVVVGSLVLAGLWMTQEGKR